MPVPGSPLRVPLTVVGIGASAGGLEACMKLVRGLPDGNGMAFILVQHLDPTHDSLLVELLATHTAMAVIEATDGMPLEPDHVFVIPPGRYLSVSGGTLHLSTPTAPRGMRLPFDFLLKSLAGDYGKRAVCVVLSGTGSDGSLGLVAIKEHGGLVLVQDPLDAEYDGMPKSAIATGVVDLVLPAADIPDALATHPHEIAVAHGEPPADADQQTFIAIIELLRATTPHDFTLYKQGTLHRRIERRMAMAGAADLPRYLELLSVDPVEPGRLASDLLINVTSFFRDPKVFERLAADIIPDRIRNHDGTDSSSDGQYFRAGGRAEPGGDVNAKYGIDPGVVLYTTQSGQYGPMHTRVISATASEAPYVLDGLHPQAHRTSLSIAEHYTDTAGATDHVFGLCHLLGYRFAPRIKDLKDRKLYAVEKPDTYPVLKPLIGDAVDTTALVRGWAELLRVRASIEVGAVAPSTILRKLAAAGPNNALSQVLRALGCLERTLFTLQWLSDPALRQRSHAGLNKGEASNALRPAVFFHRQGEFRDRTFENQSFRASGLSLLTAAIVHWNTIYLDLAVQQLRAQGVSIPDELLAHVAPLGWEHIALTGDYDWNTAKPVHALRPLRAVPEAFYRRAA